MKRICPWGNPEKFTGTVFRAEDKGNDESSEVIARNNRLRKGYD